jgi:hypothetical protein
VPSFSLACFGIAAGITGIVFISFGYTFIGVSMVIVGFGTAAELIRRG